MVDEWPFEFLPGNSSLIFRIILASNFATVHTYPPSFPSSSPRISGDISLLRSAIKGVCYACIRISAMGS